MITSVLFEAEKSCFGCGACEQICSRRAIRMCPDTEGFRFPRIDLDLCVECHLCVQVCPALPENRDRTLNLPRKVYAARNKDPKMLMHSTSGAVFPLFARAMLAQGGSVYGCAWIGDGLEAAHIRVDHEQDMHRLSQSKYVQSSTEETFRAVQFDLKRKLPVLFSGTPCQIAGLRLFLRQEYAELLTIDLLCHGVPSPAMFSTYAAGLACREKGPIADFKFRDKQSSGFRAYVSYRLPNGKRRFLLAGLEPYLFGFYREFFSRESCYRCPFQQFRRTGDVTLGDYWGLEHHHPELAEWSRYGASLCLINTLNGLRWMSVLETSAELAESTIEYAASKNPALDTPPASHHRPELRGKIYRELQEHGFDWIAVRYLRPSFVWLHRLIPAWVKNFLRILKRRK